MTLTSWLARTAHPLTDLEPLHDIVGDAVVVGLGESCHGASELFTVKDRMLRFLVEHKGFRAVAWEDDWTWGQRVDQYVTGGDGDPRELLADAIIVWRTEEILATLTWLREYNAAHPADMVRFVGVDILFSRNAAPADPLDVQQAKVIAASHAFYECAPQDRFAYRDRQMAENLIWWHEQTGARVAYWAHNAHTANDPERMSTGAHLRSRFGKQYVSVATTFDHGAPNVGLQAPRPHEVPPPQPTFADAAFGNAEFLLDLRAPAPEPVREWLAAPAFLRAIGPTYDPTADADHNMSGGALGDWFDALVHLDEVGPTRLLPSA